MEILYRWEFKISMTFMALLISSNFGYSMNNIITVFIVNCLNESQTFSWLINCVLISCKFRLNQSLSWPFREVVATALYDFSPREQNQLPLRQGCQVLVIGKEGDSKGWWRGKTMERVIIFWPLFIFREILNLFCLIRLGSFRKNTFVNIRQHRRNYDVTITWYSFQKKSQTTQITTVTWIQSQIRCHVMDRYHQVLQIDQFRQLQVAPKAVLTNKKKLRKSIRQKQTVILS